eukprot:SAG31_NODE_18351_length_639_cov_1.050000_1_plen_51_part_10
MPHKHHLLQLVVEHCTKAISVSRKRLVQVPKEETSKVMAAQQAGSLLCMCL